MANITRTGTSSLSPLFSRDPFETMRNLLRWDPFAEMTPTLPSGEEATFVPRFEVKERKDAYVFEADLPGIKEEDLDISLTGNRLTVSGHREAERSEEEERYFAWERSYGRFSRSFTLPEGVDSENANAELKNGVLTLTLPKKPELQPKKISLSSGLPAKTKGAVH